MSYKYGVSWWGNLWLETLGRATDENRFNRGRQYANKNNIKDLIISSDIIRSLVKGTYRPFYQVSIALLQVPDENKKRFIDTIKKDIVLCAQLMNKNIDKSIVKIARDAKINLFPKDLSDFDINCNCYDFWGDPCKHIAATFFALIREIDNEPLVLFDLIGIDLLSELSFNDDKLTTAEQKNRHVIPEFKDIFELISLKAENVEKIESEDKNIANLKKRNIDFTKIPALKNSLMQVLSHQPNFFPDKDFHDIYFSQLKNAALFAQSDLDSLDYPENIIKKKKIFQFNDKPLIKFALSSVIKDHNYNYNRYLSTTQLTPEYTEKFLYRNFNVLNCEKLNNVDDIAQACFNLNLDDLGHMSDEVQFIHQIYLFCLHLIKQSAILPNLFYIDNNIALMWAPFELDENIKRILEHFISIAPERLIIADYRLQPNQNIPKAAMNKTLSAQNQVFLLCAMFINHFMQLAFCKIAYPKLSKRMQDNKTMQLFFYAYNADYTNIGEISIPNNIYAWLSRLNLGSLNYKIILKIASNTEENCFNVSIDIENKINTDENQLQNLSYLLNEDISKENDLNLFSLKMNVVKNLQLLAEFYSPINDYIQNKAKEPISISLEDFPDLLFKILPVMKLMGIKIILPKALQDILIPSLTLQLKNKKKSTSSSSSASFLKMDDLFNFDWKVALGSHLINIDEFQELVKNSTGIIQFKGEYIYLNPEDIAALKKSLHKPPRVSPTDLFQAALTGKYDQAAIYLDDQAQNTIDEFLKIKEIALPKKLNAQLRPYQKRGYEWLYRNIKLGLGSIIADDMGLGKTLQVITVLQKLKEDGLLKDKKVLIIVPTTLITNWCKEVQKFCPNLSVDVFHGQKREINQKRADILLTTYGILRKSKDILNALDWYAIIIDEAQNIKNTNTEQTKSIKMLKANVRIAMSGTPVENRLIEYWSIMDFVNHGYLGSITSFNKTYAHPIQILHDEQKIQQFKKVTEPFVLRRLKSDKTIINDLPDKIEQNEYCTLTKNQAALYESVLKEAMRTIESIDDAADSKQLFKKQGLVLQMILALKQVCNHPLNYIKQSNDNKEIDPLNSGKMNRLFDLLDDIYAANEKVLIFTQFTEMGTLLEQWINEKYHRMPLFLNGSSSSKKRDDMVMRFQNNALDNIFILSIKAGGTGLNLTAATHVIHYDLWWNPAVEAQATDRAYRIGQNKNVQVHRFITQATFEEKINDMIQAKKKISDLTVGSGEKWIGNLSNQEIKQLFKLSK